MAALRRRWRPVDLGDRPAGVWRYREVLPDCDPIGLGEGGTPLLAAVRVGESLGLRHLWIKDESQNPTGSFKARGAAVAVAAALAAGATRLAIASAGNAAAALSAYAARAGIEAHCYLPDDTPRTVVEEVRAYGGRITSVDGPLSEAGRRLRAAAAENGWFDMSTFREPFRLEGKKTMGYELFEQLDGRLPDWILYPTGGGMGLMGLWKAFSEMESLGWIDAHRPRMVAVQASGCAPLVQAFRDGTAEAAAWGPPRTIAVGLRVPVCAASDILLPILRRSGGAAVEVGDAAIWEAARELSRREAVCAGPEGGAALAALRKMRDEGQVGTEDRVVLFNTGWGGKYIDRPEPPA
jgi:threonine synthase